MWDSLSDGVKQVSTHSQFYQHHSHSGWLNWGWRLVFNESDIRQEHHTILDLPWGMALLFVQSECSESEGTSSHALLYKLSWPPQHDAYRWSTLFLRSCADLGIYSTPLIWLFWGHFDDHFLQGRKLLVSRDEHFLQFKGLTSNT